MALSREDVDYAYRLILGHPPEDQKTVNQSMRKFADLDALRAHLFESKQFRKAMLQLMAGKRVNPGNAMFDLAERKLVFLHIRKSAGTTLADMLDRHYPEAETFSEYQALLKTPALLLGRYRFFRGHLTLHGAQYIPGEKFIFTLLREPRSRLLSQYRFHKVLTAAGRRPEDSLQSKAMMPLKAYLKDREVREHAWLANTQCRALFHVSPDAARKFQLRKPYPKDPFETLPADVLLGIARDNLESLDFFGLVEKFDRSADLLFQALGLPPPQAQDERNVTKALLARRPRIAAQITLDEPDDEDYAAMDGMVTLDAPLYRYAVSRFAERFDPPASQAAA